MKVRQLISLMISISILFVFGTVVLAQTYTPDVQVAGTGIVNGTVTIVKATITGSGWVVIHADADGKPGPVIGHAPLSEGTNTNVSVPIDTKAATPNLFAMLHIDAGAIGNFEFPGPDVPVKIGDNIVMARFSATQVIPKESETPAPASMPVTGAGTSTLLVFVVVATVLFFLTAGVVISHRRV